MNKISDGSASENPQKDIFNSSNALLSMIINVFQGRKKKSKNAAEQTQDGARKRQIIRESSSEDHDS